MGLLPGTVMVPPTVNSCSWVDKTQEGMQEELKLVIVNEPSVALDSVAEAGKLTENEVPGVE